MSDKLTKFKEGKRYEVHNNKEGLLVIKRQDENILVNIDGEEIVKKIGNFVNSEFVWTDEWHVAIAYKEIM